MNPMSRCSLAAASVTVILLSITSAKLAASAMPPNVRASRGTAHQYNAFANEHRRRKVQADT